jgi:hypothetical protein
MENVMSPVNGYLIAVAIFCLVGLFVGRQAKKLTREIAARNKAYGE